MAQRIQSTRGNTKRKQASKLEVKLTSRRGTGGTTITLTKPATTRGKRPSGATVVLIRPEWSRAHVPRLGPGVIRGGGSPTKDPAAT